MPIELGTIVEAAKLIAAYNEKRSIEASTLAGFARIIQENNDALIRDMSSILRQAFSQAKLTQCNNTLQTLSTFFQDYAENPAGIDKIKECDLQAAYVMDILDDEDIAFAGIRSYLAAASLRIGSLLLRSVFEPDAFKNAVSLSKKCIEYVAKFKPLLINTTEQRVSPVTTNLYWSEGGEGPGGQVPFCTGVSRVFLDGAEVFTDTKIISLQRPPGQIGGPEPDRAEVEQKLEIAIIQAVRGKRQKLIDKLLAELPLNEMAECSKYWKTFADAH